MTLFGASRHSIKIILLLFFAALVKLSEAQSLDKFVNPFIGTQGTGHTFPGPSMPFGMVQPGPDNQDFGWNHTSGYQYNDTHLLGFSQTRFSGTGINEMGDILILPINPKLESLTNSYDKETEIAKIGYYSLIKRDKVKVELTCSERVTFHQYTFPERDAIVFLNFQHGLRFVFTEIDTSKLVIESSIRIENNHTISGYCSTKNWVNRTYFFTLTFDQPFVNSNLIQSIRGEKAPKYRLKFSLSNSKLLKVKVALSTTSIEGAKKNLLFEINHWDFQKVKNQNRKTWNSYLSRIQIKAPNKQKILFYTAMYHLLLQPSNIADIDGKYRGANRKISTAPNKEYYSTLSIWDIYRGAFPLLQIIAPEKIPGIIQTMLIHFKDEGFLPIWTAWGQDNYCMIGNHAIPMILSAFQNGFSGFNPKEALNAMVETSLKSHINSHWELYNKYGYYPFDSIDNESVSRTLESNFDDWCVAEMSRKLGDTILLRKFQTRSRFYQNLYDQKTSFFRGKDSRGNWRNPFNPLMATSPLNNPGDYTEANAWQYFWTPAQYDVEGMNRLLGGIDQFQKKLDSFFSITSHNANKFLGQEAMIGQYAHANEPSHHIVYLYGYTPNYKTGQKYIHKIINDFHDNKPNGMIGNDDCGQMSAWYIFSTLGFYPVNAGNGNFIFGSPQIKKAILKLPNNKKFYIKTDHFSQKNIYQSNPELNKTFINRIFLEYSEIMKGGVLKFHMQSE